MIRLVFIWILVFASVTFAKDIIGEADTKGTFFPDTIRIVAFDDPDLKGITCYTTYYDKALTLTDSSDVSISCRKTGPVIGKPTSRKEIFSQDKNFFFKKTVVHRFYDAKRGVLAYLTVTEATSGDNASHSLSVVVINE